MKPNKKIRNFLLTCNVVLATVAVAFIDIRPVDAVSENYADVIKNAPEGLDISKYFDVGKFSLASGQSADDYPFQTNSATIYQSGNANDEHNNQVLNLAMGGENVPSSADSSDEIKLSQTGAAWSKIDDETANYIDITKKQTVSVWLYFGAGTGNDSRENGEGMALVLHNDPRGTSAMGAGYQGMGALGFDNQRVTETRDALGLLKWSMDASAETSYATPKQVAETAVAKSIALDFNSQLNSLISTNNLIDPIKTGRGQSYKISAVNVGRPLLYSLGSFGTVKESLSPPGDYPEYSGLVQNTKPGEYALRLGNSNNAFGDISLTYPGSDFTYKEVPMVNLRYDDKINPLSRNEPWNAINKGSLGQGISTFQALSKSASLSNGYDNLGEDIYWHHVTFTWMPAANGKPASINYDFNDKYPDGTVNTGQSKGYSEVSATIPVDQSIFGNPTNNRVYWGLTGSNSDLADTYSKLAIFESIPALATATVDTQLSDVTLNPPKVIVDESKDNVVGNGHDVEFNYKLTWDDTSRKDWTNINSEIHLPLDIDYTKATITFHNASGSSEPITIAGAADMSDNLLQYTIASLGNIASKDGYTSADITVSGKANNQTSVPITEDPEPATFTGDQAIATSSTPKFVIDSNLPEEKLLELEVSNDLVFQDINYRATNEYLQRKTPFVLKVKNLKEAWNLKVSGDELFNGSQPFEGDVVYKTTDNSEPIVLDNSLQQIATGSASDTTTTVDLASKWSENSGLLLHTDPDDVMPAGKYTGELTWELNDM